MTTLKAEDSVGTTIMGTDMHTGMDPTGLDMGMVITIRKMSGTPKTMFLLDSRDTGTKVKKGIITTITITPPVTKITTGITTAVAAET